jgi:flagellar biosynthetic protein FliQ
MAGSDIAELLRECMLVTMKLGGPILCAALFIGLLISILQAITQINEATLAFLPKIATIALVILLMRPYFVRVLTEFSSHVFDRIVAVGGL